MAKKAPPAVTTVTPKSRYLSHFTPSMMPAATLEELLVQRAGLVDRIVKSAVDSIKTGSLHHHLFVGPRGIGKTHLISLLFHRLASHKTIQSKAKLLWMREEEWGVTSFFELVLRILRNMDANDPSLGIKAQTESLYALPSNQLESAASDILLGVLQGKTLVLLLENLDDLFEQMGDAGQKKWRAFIQNHPQVVMLATTPALFKGVTSQKSAFYGAFDTEALDEMSFDEVVELLQKIALYRGDQELADYIHTPQGKARIRAVHHLAEGNPRIYIIFAQFLSKVALDELVQAFMHTLDELTPYYQARMKEQSGQQRKILEFLVQYRGAAPVKEIAKACFITQQTCSSQLLVLRERRFVRVQEQGRERYYELQEPLMRLCMEVKTSRGQAHSLMVDMLRIWYSEQELEGLKKGQERMSAMALQCVEKALDLKRQELIEPALEAVVKDLVSASEENNLSKATPVLEEFVHFKTKDKEFQALQFVVDLALLRQPNAMASLEPDKKEAVKLQIVRVMTECPRLFMSESNLYDMVIWISVQLGLSSPSDDVLLQKLIKHTEETPTPIAGAVLKSLFLATKNKEDSQRFNTWIMQWLQALAQQRACDQAFQNPFLRMIKAIEDFLQKPSENTSLLALPVEERKLVLQILKTKFKGADQ